jgi:hypothetical protein
MQMNSDLLEKLNNWINSEGIPLEYYAASVFTQNRFRVFQGDYVKDKAAAREVDVLAFKDYENKEGLLRICNVIECKWTKDKPWIVFTSPTAHIANSACIAQTLGSKVGSSLLWHVAGEPDLYNLTLFESKKSSGFSGRQAFSKDNDLFYNMVQSIINKTFLSVKEYDNYIQDPFNYIAIGFPVIVIDGLLFESNYINDNIELSEVKFSKIHWRGSSNWKLHATVTVVTKDYLPTYVSIIASEFDVLAGLAISALENIKYLQEMKDANVLNHKAAPRGILGYPSFIYDIIKSFGP